MRDAGVALCAVQRGSPGRVAQGFSALRAASRREAYVMYRRHYHRQVAAAITATAAVRAPDVLYLDHLDSFVYPDCARALTVGDLHNVYSTLLARTADEQPSSIWRWYMAREARLLALAEQRAAVRARLLLAVSSLDAAHFSDIGATDVAVVPNGVDCVRYADLPVGREQSPPVILFLGAMSWAPNASAAEFLAVHVLPRVRQVVPDARLQIVGREPSDRVKALAQCPGVEVTGAVKDVRPYLENASMLAVPLTAGGGTRLKILEAFAAGLPVVSTPVGCEGIDAENGRHLLVADPSDFVDAVARGLADRGMLSRLAAEARALARDRYDWDAIGRRASEAIVAARLRQATATTA
jgi:glycosyltransferase involved in cell wall biosynthesis